MRPGPADDPMRPRPAASGGRQPAVAVVRHRPAHALLGALVCLAGLLVTGGVALILPVAQAHDSATLAQFAALSGHSRVADLATRLAHTVDPSRYLVIALLLAAVALVRGRPRVAAAVPVVMFGASATTELLKPLIGNPRNSDWLSPGGNLNAASWPSGHATAAMMVALCGVLVAPRLLRPLAALLGTGLAVGVSYSILVLGWHFPSDVLAGFLVAGGWVSFALAVLWWAEARHPERRSRLTPPGRVSAIEPFHPPAGWLAPAALLAATFAAAAGVLAARGRLVETYSIAHLSFVAGALAIAALAALLATGVAVALRR
ncbi:MAG: phosphatase PAP2 family protein [Solirubrobacteraceae bacterium]